MDDTTREAVEHLEYLARRGGLTEHEKGSILLVLAALESALVGKPTRTEIALPTTWL